MKNLVYQLQAAGGTLNFDPAAGFDGVFIGSQGGAVTLTSSFTLTCASNPVGARVIKTFWSPAVTLDGNNCTVFGKQLTAQEAQSKGVIYSMFNPWTNAFNSVFSADDGTSSDVTEIDISANLAGGTVDLSPRKQSNKYLITGSGTLTGNLNLALLTSGAVEGDPVEIIYAASIELGGRSLTVASLPIFGSAARNGGWAIQGFFKTSWYMVPVNMPLYSENNTAAVYVKKSGSAPGDYAGLEFETEADLAVGYDAEAAEMKANFAAIRYAEIDIPASDVSAMDVTQIVLVAKSADPSKTIDIVGNILAETVGVTTPYSGSGALGIKYDGADFDFRQDASIIKSTVDRISLVSTTVSLTGNAAGTQILRNADLVAYLTAAMTGGDCALKISFYYRYR